MLNQRGLRFWSAGSESLALALVSLLICGGLYAQSNEVLVPAGVFQMGCSPGDTQCERDEGEMGGIEVFVPAFYIDIYEVTVDQYGACITAGACQRPKDFERNKYCNFAAPGRGDHPVNCVDWQEALDYCEWQGKRLPYEAEWEKAARAGTLSRYPWGQEVSCEQAIVDDGVTMGSVPGEPDGCGEDHTWPVGSRAPNALGLYDMHGNAGEWVMNWYAADALKQYAAGNLRNQAESPRKVLRGGSWDENKPNLRSSFRNTKPPLSGRSPYGSIGLRCARDA